MRSKKSRRKRYAACDDVVEARRVDPPCGRDASSKCAGGAFVAKAGSILVCDLDGPASGCKAPPAPCQEPSGSTHPLHYQIQKPSPCGDGCWIWWRRGELNSCPKTLQRELLRAQTLVVGRARFPLPPVNRQTDGSGSFIVHGALKALRTHVRLLSTPRIRAEALPEGTGHGLGRGQNSVVVVL